MVEALGIDLKEIIFAIANFLILLAVLAKFMYKPFLANLERRKQMIEDAISNAEAVNKRADEKMNSYNKRIAGAEREAAGIINEAKIKADKQASQIIDESNEKAALIMQKAEQEIERQKDAAITEAREMCIRDRFDGCIRNECRNVVGFFNHKAVWYTRACAFRRNYGG